LPAAGGGYFQLLIEHTGRAWLRNVRTRYYEDLLAHPLRKSDVLSIPKEAGDARIERRTTLRRYQTNRPFVY